MTKYKLEDFKTWLESDQSRKAGLTGWDTDNSYFVYWNSHPDYFEQNFISAAQGNPKNNTYTAAQFLPYVAVAKKWIAEVDSSEKSKKAEQTEQEKQLTEKNELIGQLQVQNTQLERKLTKISTILFPKSVYDFDNLEAEIKRLKIKEIVPELPIKKRQLSDLISKCKIQLSSDLKPFFDLYLRSLSAKEEDPIKKIKLETKLEVYEEILSTKVNESDLIQSKKLQLEVNDLQEHLDNLQFSESELQIQILPK